MDCKLKYRNLVLLILLILTFAACSKKEEKVEIVNCAYFTKENEQLVKFVVEYNIPHTYMLRLKNSNELTDLLYKEALSNSKIPDLAENIEGRCKVSNYLIKNGNYSFYLDLSEDTIEKLQEGELKDLILIFELKNNETSEKSEIKVPINLLSYE